MQLIYRTVDCINYISVITLRCVKLKQRTNPKFCHHHHQTETDFLLDSGTTLDVLDNDLWKEIKKVTQTQTKST